jgi:hypothetical protein
MSLPQFKTQFVDGYWLDLVKGLKTGVYMPEVIIEHRHYITGKRKKDEISLKVSRESAGECEFFKSSEYTNILKRDLERLKI